EIQALNERIQVLESIVTEEGYQVQKDINQL
ncbi:MAG: phage shock protein C, partial [Colwellia sp.]